MSNRPPLNWSRTLQELKADRAVRQPVREEFVRPAGMRGAASLALSAWRGNSGRRYVVGVHRLDAFDPADADGSVMLFVKRDPKGVASIMFGANAPSEHFAQTMLRVAAGKAAVSEIHVHRLCDDHAERNAILADLDALSMAEVA